MTNDEWLVLLFTGFVGDRGPAYRCQCRDIFTFAFCNLLECKLQIAKLQFAFCIWRFGNWTAICILHLKVWKLNCNLHSAFEDLENELQFAIYYTRSGKKTRISCYFAIQISKNWRMSQGYTDNFCLVNPRNKMEQIFRNALKSSIVKRENSWRPTVKRQRRFWNTMSLAGIVSLKSHSTYCRNPRIPSRIIIFWGGRTFWRLRVGPFILYS